MQNIAALLVDLWQFEVDNVNLCGVKFEIVEIQIGEVKVEETTEKACDTAVAVEIIDVAVEVDSEFQLNAINLDIPETKVNGWFVEELSINDLEADVKVSISNGRVVKVVPASNYKEPEEVERKQHQ